MAVLLSLNDNTGKQTKVTMNEASQRNDVGFRKELESV
jgi:hypothetical protein